VQHSFSDWHNAPLKFTQPKAARKTKDIAYNDEWCGSIFSEQIDVWNFTHLPVLQSQVSRSGSFTPGAFCAYLTELKEKFSFSKPMLAFKENPICSWRSNYIWLCHHRKIGSRKIFAWGPTGRPVAQQYSKRKAQEGEHCRLLVNLCSEEIVRTSNSVCSEYLDLLRIYKCCVKVPSLLWSNHIKTALPSDWSAFDRLQLQLSSNQIWNYLRKECRLRALIRKRTCFKNSPNDWLQLQFANNDAFSSDPAKFLSFTCIRVRL